MNDKGKAARGAGAGRRPLREDIAGIDKDILRLLARRGQLIEKLRHNGKIETADEKFLREAWQREVARVSHDAELSGRFFSLMQSVTFLPRPESNDSGSATALPGAQRREAFNLAPSRQPVKIAMTAPLSGTATRAWLYLAAASGKPLRMEPCLQNDSIIDCVKAFVQMGGAISREDEAITAREFEPLSRPDKVIHAGDCLYNLCLFIAHYIGRPSRVKFTGGTTLKLADLTPLARVLPSLGARLTPIVPKSNGLPARLESSGMLPSSMLFTADLPREFAECLLLAAPFYEKPFALNISPHPHKLSIMAYMLPILEKSGAAFVVSDQTINLQPSSLCIPECPQLPVEPALAAPLLAFAEPLGGIARLKGHWPDWPETGELWTILEAIGLRWQKDSAILEASSDKPARELNFMAAPAELLEKAFEWTPLLLGLAACAALNGKNIFLPDTLARNNYTPDFLNAAGLECQPGNKLVFKSGLADNIAWNAPTPSWAMALALAACARREKQRFLLGNPGIMTELWPQFWAFYNSLPCPSTKRAAPAPQPQPKSRRRILTNAIAQVPEMREEDF